jgi:hypothetical protein
LFNIVVIFAPTIIYGDVAQSVEQRTENPCVGGSIPSITTQKTLDIITVEGFFVFGGFWWSGLL